MLCSFTKQVLAQLDSLDVSVLASGRLLKFGLRHWPSVLRVVVFLHKTGAGEDLLRYCQETAAHKDDIYLLPTELDAKVAKLHFPALGAELSAI